MLSTSLESPWSKETKQVGKEWHSRGCVILWCSFVRFKLVFNAKNEYRINVHNFMLMQIQSRCSFTFPTSPRTQIKHSNWPINLKVQFSPVGWQNTVCSHLTNHAKSETGDTRQIKRKILNRWLTRFSTYSPGRVFEPEPRRQRTRN